MLDSSPEEEDFPGRLLHQAALWDNTELLEDLLEGGQQTFINSQDSWGRTPLHAAVITEHSKCLELLLNAGADPNIPCGPRGEDKTPLHLCAEYGYYKNSEILIQHNADIWIKDMNNLNALDISEKSGHIKVVELLKQAADAKEKIRLDIHAAIGHACSQGDVNSVQQLLLSLQKDAELIINMAPSGANTLLFSACEAGNSQIVKTLLEYGADGRCHSVTKYSPLYIACYQGHRDIVEMLLLKFPELVQQHTVERWLPIHAACINGHVQVLELLFYFPYPSHLLRKYRDSTEQWEYFMPYDVNERDATGQNILYVASLLGNKKLVEAILKFKVKATRIIESASSGDDLTPLSEPILSPTKRRISDGIMNIMSKLHLTKDSSPESEFDGNTRTICPLRFDMYCNNNTETALHAAIKGKHYDITLALLNGGANPNAAIKPYHDLNEDVGCCSVDEDVNYTSSGLVEACKNRDVAIVDLLLKRGARDDECKALSVAVANKDETLIAKLLSTKAHPDPEYKINKKSMTENINSHMTIFSTVSSLTYSNLFPNTPTMINWHNQKCGLSEIKTQWLIDAALSLNQKLKQNPKSYDIALFSITRLDISNNNISALPLAVFSLQSLKYLNVSQNKIEKLPLPEASPSKKNSKKKSNVQKELNYSCVVLEELYLQDNRIDQIPEAIFRLPNLITLVVSNNKLQLLPFEMWLAPKLKELNASFNLLKDLPRASVDTKEDLDRMSVSSSDSHLSSFAEVDSENEITEFDKIIGNEDAIHAVRYRKKERFYLQLDLNRHHLWSKNVEVTEQILHSDEALFEKCSQLSSLNLAHNLFTSIPVVLPCLAVNLTRLNMAFNTLRSMSHITSYPSSLKQLDLSHNQITVWPSLPQVEAKDNMELANLACYMDNTAFRGKLSEVGVRRHSSRSVRHTVLHSVCVHRRHLRLDNLRTLILADNRLSRIQLSTDDDGDISSTEDDETERNTQTQKARLIFPNLSMLDISNNSIKEIPTNINELTNLSVLNISGNLDINELPPQMGLLSRLWNLNTRGCSLQDPLKFMIESKKYKTMDIIGYLKSVLEDAKPYARMKLMIVGVQGIGKTSLLEQLRQEGTTKRRPEHWAKRMGNKNINVKTSKGTNMSTVGVDIGDWVYEKKIRNQSTYGPVVFRTWDFGGQREYYATHQYFLSKRSLYLVVWKITDGHRGINEILQWLVNIQARAPNSPVIIVGTHYDVVQEFNPNISEDYQQIIRDRFINVVDAEKCGLPRVLDTIEISCKTKHNIKLLCNLIYDTVFSLKPPGSKELLLEQKVPATYLALEDVVNYIAAERRINGLDPVLTSEQYKSMVIAEMQQRYNKTFRDWAELHQATLFLHDNGVLLHYDDATLKDLYFLDPQWLCDMLAHVVTIREINPFARTGVMKLDDLKHVFKASNIGPIDTRGYVVNLLNKFEVALTWDSRTLLIPSLLPSEEDMILAQMYPGQAVQPMVKVKVPLRSRGWAVRNKKLTVSPKSVLYKEGGPQEFQMSMPSSSNKSIAEPIEEIFYEVSSRQSDKSMTRLLLMSYFPSGFWSRLVSRILADDTIVDIIRSFFVLPKDLAHDINLAKCLDLKAEWILWQTGLQLKYGDITLFRIKEVLHNSAAHYRQFKFKIKQDGLWCDVDLQNSSILEIYFPVDSLVVKPKRTDGADISQFKIKDELVIECTQESTTQLLALAVDHIDILLEDWYPTLGTRFVHTSEGKFLVTRLIPCPQCLGQSHQDYLDPSHASSSQSQDMMHRDKELDNSHYNRDYYKVRQSQESYNSECDSGVGPDSNVSSRNASVEGHPAVHLEDQTARNTLYYSWMVEECILASYSEKAVTCPLHGDIKLLRVAPDTMFLDLGERYIIKKENIKKGRLLGRGAFGFVFRGTCKVRGSNNMIDVAMKMLQPVQPGPNARQSAIMAYKASQGKWDRDPLQYACKAYCTARQELNILLSLRHPNIVPFVGVCTSPLALVLDLAPQGALDLVLRHYRRSGAKVGPYTMQAIILQVAKAIEYLHRQHIIYRDLKSENVLVWEMPPPFVDDADQAVHIKVADYGISRLTLPSGTKGFGGTEGFMAPEIMRYNGEEEYTEKVDCFSFGMFIYELLTLHQPFEGHESVKECILDGGRPPLTYRETLYPSYFLDLMVLCWSQQPKDRPSASQIVSIASAPEFTHLCDIISLKHPASVVAATSAALTYITDDGLSGSEMWLMCENSRVDLLLAADRGWLQYHTMSLPIRPSATCTVGDTVWIGDCCGTIHAYSSSDGRKLFFYSLETEPNTKIQALLYLPSLKRVACALSNGRLFLVNSEQRPVTPTAAEGTFVMTELGLNSGINCMCAIIKDERNCELWCGGSNGQITIYLIKDQVVTGHEVLNHYQPVIDIVDVINLVSVDNIVWSYVRPGCVVYQWDVTSRSIVNKLDCSKLVPCSESLKSIAIEEHLSPTNCQVSSLVVLNDELYIGTTWGCIIIAERNSLRPATIFRPYEEEVKLIVPLAVPKSNNESHDNIPLIATIGRGYRNLLSRYTDVPLPVGTPLPSPVSANYTNYLNKPNMFILLWRAENWNAV